jgi:protein SCO1
MPGFNALPPAPFRPARPMMKNLLARLSALGLVLSLTLGLAFSLTLAGCSEPPAFKSTDITGSDWGKDFSLTDHHGQPRRLADFKGKAVVLFFGFTQCPDVCPTTLSAMHETMKLLGADAERVQVLFVSLDPERDTPELLAQYVPQFNPSFLGLRTDAEGTAAIAREFKVFYARQPGKTPDSYTIDHSTGSFAFDPQGRLRLLLRHGETPANIAADLKLLLAGK